jgi:glutamate-ammonia-ligase adenylyltransferase
MSELSLLAEIIVEESLQIVRSQIREIYGEPEDWSFTVLAVGKLGSRELNFSSDIDLLYVYKEEEGETSGVMTPQRTVKNRIGNHEYYCKLGEALNKFLSATTEEGFGYRVDLRLRPEGQRGNLAISLSAYETYYESWGRAWERAVLLRARPIAGDMDLGKAFLQMVKPFVYRKYLDFTAIEEIRKMKSKIDETFKKDDIKRGRGGIREIEFFVHALQLIYGGKEPLLRERSTIKGLYQLLQKNLVGYEDYSILSDNYLLLRRLEHRLQQVNDLQTHSLPSGDQERLALSRKMGFPDTETFFSELDKRRSMVRRIYDSLFIERRAAPREDHKTSLLLSEELSDGEFRNLLTDYSIKDVGRVIRNIHHIRDSTRSFQTLRGQRLLSAVLPAFLREALRTRNPDTAVNNLESFVTILSSEESYLDLFAKNERLIPILIRLFSQSEYLAKTIMKRREYLELLGHEIFPRKTLASLKEELKGITSAGQQIAEAIRIFKQMEEIRLGILFLDRKIDVIRLMKELSKTADAIVSHCMAALGPSDNLAVVGLGKSGGRELTFASDLDLIFVCDDSVTDSAIKTAERLIRLLISYTQDGTAYSVDTRLRPEGSKGPLVLTVEAFRDYYLRAAHFWEFQALLKARPLAGDRAAGYGFMAVKKRVLTEKGEQVAVQDVRAMRERIEREISKEAEGYDIKLGPGGLEELEFTVQYLQLKNVRRHDRLLVQGTLDGIGRLWKYGVIDKMTAHVMRDAYVFFRTLESFLRLVNEPVLKEGSMVALMASELMEMKGADELITVLREKRLKVKEMFEKLA